MKRALRLVQLSMFSQTRRLSMQLRLSNAVFDERSSVSRRLLSQIMSVSFVFALRSKLAMVLFPQSRYSSSVKFSIP